LAVRNLIHQPVRTLVSLCGVSFAILLMYMQLGFLGSVGDTAVLVYRELSADLVVRSPEYLSVYDPRSLDASVVNRLAVLPEVVDVRTLDLSVGSWQNPNTGDYRAVAMMGIDLDAPAVRLPELSSYLPILRRVDLVLLDDATRADYGAVNGVDFNTDDIGRETTINSRAVSIAGLFRMGTGLAANGAILTSRQGFERLMLGTHHDRVSLTLVSLAPHIELANGKRAVQARLRNMGGPLAFADVLTLDEAASAERRHWYRNTPIGLIFWIGVGMAFIVGAVICYMVLAADVLARLPEYATLKAMGYRDQYLARTLLAQASYLACLSLPVATFGALVLYRVTSELAGLPIRMTWLWIVIVSVLSLSMCNAAGLFALRKLARAEPASLF
jgi:putative ABC transport system permease protein